MKSGGQTLAFKGSIGVSYSKIYVSMWRVVSSRFVQMSSLGITYVRADCIEWHVAQDVSYLKESRVWADYRTFAMRGYTLASRQRIADIQDLHQTALLNTAYSFSSCVASYIAGGWLLTRVGMMTVVVSPVP